jgi:S1-C subfamily serine protease
MKASFLRPRPGPLSHSTARNAALLNQCATPGLGSLMAGRRFVGIGQLLVAVVGFVLVVAWFVLVSLQIYEQLVNDAEPKSVASVGEAGAVVFLGSWLWSLVTSLSILREARANERKSVTPPVITLVLGMVLLAAGALADSPRIVIDDEEYVEKVTEASARLLQGGKLKSLDSLRGQVRSGGFDVKSVPLAHQKLEAPELCDRLRQSTLAIGSYYKCPDCGEWHFNSSAGFVVGEGGVICTCCHVVQAEDEGVKESYLVAADDAGRVFPVQSVLAADTESDTCFVKINAPGLKPLPLRAGARAGERVYCLSHPGGYFFMFTQGMVARVNRKRNEVLDEHGQTNGLLTRPILFLNVTAEFAPGSSGAPIVDEAGNVVAQVASIADAGEPPVGNTNAPPSPSVPVRFCTATEEILRLTRLDALAAHEPPGSNAPTVRPRLHSPH